MPWLPMYATKKDMEDIFSYLNNEEEIAFLVSNGTGHWIAKKHYNYINDTRCVIWHIPNNPLPLLSKDGKEKSIVEDPWVGWKEERTGADPTNPYFGPEYSGIMWLNARTSSKSTNNGIGLSSFEWTGNYYKMIGYPTPKGIEQFWKKLRRRIQKNAIKIPRTGAWDGPNPEAWALPDALAKIKNGTNRDYNPY